MPESHWPWFKNVISEDFGTIPSRLETLSRDAAGEPIFGNHLDILTEALNIKLPSEYETNLRAAYIYLTILYMLVDAAHDGHNRCPGDDLFISAVAFATHKRICALDRLSCSDGHYLEKLLFKTLLSNRDAIISTDHIQSNFERATQADERNIVVGRSNSFILLGQAIQYATQQSISSVLFEASSQFIFFMQLGDDLGDWREDYSSGRWTPFLKRCAAARGPFASINELEEAIYFDGLLEEEAIHIVKGLEGLSSYLVSNFERPLSFMHLIDRQIVMLKNQVDQFLLAKSDIDYDED